MRSVLFAGLFLASNFSWGADLIWTTIDISPFSFIADKKETGLNHDLVDEIAKRTGLTFSLKRENKAKSLNDLRRGIGHFTFGYLNKDIESYIDAPICLFSTAILAISRKGLALKKMEDLRTFKNGLGFILGSGLSNAINSDPAIKKISQHSYEEMFANIQASKLDGAVGSELGLSYFIRHEKKEALVGDKIEVGRGEYCLLVEKSRVKNPETIKVVETIAGMKKDGIPDKIFSKYIGPR